MARNHSKTSVPMAQKNSHLTSHLTYSTQMFIIVSLTISLHIILTSFVALCNKEWFQKFENCSITNCHIKEQQPIKGYNIRIYWSLWETASKAIQEAKKYSTVYRIAENFGSGKLLRIWRFAMNSPKFYPAIACNIWKSYRLGLKTKVFFTKIFRYTVHSRLCAYTEGENFVQLQLQCIILYCNMPMVAIIFSPKK